MARDPSDSEMDATMTLASELRECRTSWDKFSKNAGLMISILKESTGVIAAQQAFARIEEQISRSETALNEANRTVSKMYQTSETVRSMQEKLESEQFSHETAMNALQKQHGDTEAKVESLESQLKAQKTSHNLTEATEVDRLYELLQTQRTTIKRFQNALSQAAEREKARDREIIDLRSQASNSISEEDMASLRRISRELAGLTGTSSRRPLAKRAREDAEYSSAKRQRVMSDVDPGFDPQVDDEEPARDTRPAVGPANPPSDPESDLLDDAGIDSPTSEDENEFSSDVEDEDNRRSDAEDNDFLPEDDTVASKAKRMCDLFLLAWDYTPAEKQAFEALVESRFSKGKSEKDFRKDVDTYCCGTLDKEPRFPPPCFFRQLRGEKVGSGGPHRVADKACLSNYGLCVFVMLAKGVASGYPDRDIDGVVKKTDGERRWNSEASPRTVPLGGRDVRWIVKKKKARIADDHNPSFEVGGVRV